MDQQTAEFVEVFRALRQRDPALAEAILAMAKAFLRSLEENKKR